MPDLDAALSILTGAPPQGAAPVSQKAPIAPSPTDHALNVLSASPEQLQAMIPPTPQKQGGLVRNVGAGANEIIAGGLGAPVDAMTWFLNKTHDYIAGQQQGPTLAGLVTGQQQSKPWISNPV